MRLRSRLRKLILQDSGKKDFKDEIHVMAVALSKEMEMMENQLNRSKDVASEAHALREESESLRTLLAKKIKFKERVPESIQVEEGVGISLWRGRLHLGSRRYAGRLHWHQ